MFAKKAGYPHITSADGKQALNAYCSAHEASLLPSEPDSVGIPNVILMDINMPVMDGYESTQRIRQYENKHRLPPATVIAVSALQSEAAHAEAFGSGFNMFLSKPVKLKQLAKIIHERLEGGSRRTP
jgi:CheY-like chemotaxis protein